MKNDASTLIDDYLLGKLNDSEARAVEIRAANDPEFAQELQLQQDILKGIEHYGDEQIKAKIAALDQSLAASGFFNPQPSPVNHPPSTVSRPPSTVHRLPSTVSRLPSTVSRPPSTVWAMAASIVLLLSIGLWWMFKTTPATTSPEANNATPVIQSQPETLPAPNPAPPVAQSPPDIDRPKSLLLQQPDAKRLALARSTWSAPDFSNIRAAVQNDPSLGSGATSAFQQKQYNTVIQLLAPIHIEDPNYWPLSEMLAHAYFLSGKTEAARQRFQYIALSGELPFSERSEWFLLLCHLANFPQEEAQFDALLKKILADEGHPYFDAAQKLAKQVDVKSNQK
jgi:hypothetical protein